MKKILVTGARGFIGRHVLTTLLARDYNVHAVTSKNASPPVSGCTWHTVDLLDTCQITSLLKTVQPNYLLHFAWCTAPGEYWTSRDNLRWVQASLELLKQFQEYGGQRIVMAGTCAEYDWSYGYCTEFKTPKTPATLYGVCKQALQSMLDLHSRQTGLSSAWGRIFFVYGPYERPQRLVPSVIRAVLKGETARCSDGSQIRDFLYVQDVADAFVALLESHVRGPVNIASGEPVALQELIYMIAAKFNRDDLIQLGAVSTSPDEPPLLVADVRRLHDEVGWTPKYDLDTGLEQTIDWWKYESKE